VPTVPYFDVNLLQNTGRRLVPAINSVWPALGKAVPIDYFYYIDPALTDSARILPNLLVARLGDLICIHTQS